MKSNLFGQSLFVCLMFFFYLRQAYHIMSYGMISCHCTPYKIKSCQIISYHTISYIIPYHIIHHIKPIISYHTSYYIISYHIIHYIIHHIILYYIISYQSHSALCNALHPILFHLLLFNSIYFNFMQSYAITLFLQVYCYFMIFNLILSS